MKKDRNCGMQYNPAYPVYPGMMNPNMMGMPSMGPIVGPMPTMNQGYPTTTGTTSSTIEQQLSSMNSQINSLERRVINLESLIGSSTSKYNNSNYQVM